MIKIASNIAIAVSNSVSKSEPVIAAAVNCIAGKNIGSVIGNSKIGNKPPFTDAEVVNAAVNVPAAASVSNVPDMPADARAHFRKINSFAAKFGKKFQIFSRG